MELAVATLSPRSLSLWCGAWEDHGMLSLVPRKVTPVAVALGIGGLVVALALLNWAVPVHEVVWHNVLHHLNIIPFLLAGLMFGARGALVTLTLACVLQGPGIEQHWHRDTLDAQDQIVELTIFGLAGIVAGALADAERSQRKNLETTKVELERVYTELRESLDGMRRGERLAAAGQFATILAHEIRNPLGSISGAAGILARGQATLRTRDECVQILTKESHRLNALLTQFLEFARPRLPRFRPTDFALILDAVLSLAEHAADGNTAQITARISAEPRPVECDAEQMQQVLLNLLLNAIQASQSQGAIEVESFAAQEHYIVEIRDEGVGISPEHQGRIFEPFFTTRENGTGLGLAVAANIVSQHHGVLICTPNTKRGRGTIFRLELPFAQPAPARVNSH